MHYEISFTSLMIITGLAFIVPILVSRSEKVHIPIIVAEIIAGIIIGKSGLNLVESDPWLEFLTMFGLAYLMFLSGLEIDFGMVRNDRAQKGRLWDSSLAMGLFIYVGTLVLSFAFAYLLYLYEFIMNPALMTMVIATTSLGVVVPILKEKGVAQTQIGQTILLAAIVADFCSMFVLTFLVAWLKKTGPYQLLLMLLLFFIFFIVYFVGLKLLKRKPQYFESLHYATSYIRVRGSLALIVFFIVLSQKLGTEIILGAFLAGIIISLLSKREGSYLHMKLEAIGYGFFIPIFFIQVGVNFELGTLLHSPRVIWLVPVLLLMLYLVKMIPSLILKKVFSWRETLGAGILLAPSLSLSIAAATVGLRMGLMSEAVNSAIILVAIISVITAPLIFEHIFPKQIKREEKSVYIIGIHKNAILLAQRLGKKGKKVILLDENKRKCLKAQSLGLNIQFVDDFDKNTLQDVGVLQSEMVIIEIWEDYKNMAVARRVKDLGVSEVIAVINNTRYIPLMNEYGIKVVSPPLATLHILENIVFHPMISLFFTEGEEETQVAEVQVTHEKLAGIPLRDVKLPGDCLVVTVYRYGDIIIPHGTTILNMGDWLAIMGSREFVEQAKEMF